MRKEFAWYLGAMAPDLDHIWNTGVLTLDANVLLDLYRYNEDTRDSILSAIGSFGDRVWVSHQAASEFFANRKRVIASSGHDFDQARRHLADIGKALHDSRDKLRALRLVRREVIDEMECAVTGALEAMDKQLEEAKGAHPNYLGEDPILERLLSTFDGRIGQRIPEERRAELIKVAQARFKQKRPPGYMDEAEKEGDRRYGDYLLWAETLDFAKDGKTPVVLVTSEQKEDWWEKVSGRTLGPRLELVKEFVEETGQPVLIYRTGWFAELAAERGGRRLKPDIVQEIKAVSARRGRINPPAVDVEHLPHVATSDENLGTLDIELLREVKLMTGSGRLEPPMADVPEVRATVTTAPAGCPPLDVRGATGTTFDFNVHVRPVERGRTLPVGRYVVEYECVIEQFSGADDHDEVS